MLFHVTANADWSNLPLSGLFVDMLRRLVALSVGVAPISDNTVLAPAETFANDFLYLIKPCNYNIFDRSSSEHYSLDVQSMNAVRAYLNEVRRDDWHFAD